MSHLPFHREQLDFMLNLAGHRLEWLDPFFRFLNYFDSPYFFFVLVPVIWLGFSYRWGLRIFYWFTLNSLLIQAAKHSFGWPRPTADMPEIGLFQFRSFGFPSGGAEIAMFLGGVLIYYWRTKAAWIIGSIYIFLISFSRLYLGVHYPLDVLGGWVLAWLMLILFIQTKKPLEKWLARKGIFFSFILSIAIPLVMWILFPSTGYIVGSLIGVGIGTYFSLKHRLFLPKPSNLMEGFGRSVVGIATIFLIVLLLPLKPHFYQSCFAGLFMSLVASPVCRWFVNKKV